MSNRLKVSVEPKLLKDDRKSLSRYIQALKFHRPAYVKPGSTFIWRGSVVKFL